MSDINNFNMNSDSKNRKSVYITKCQRCSYKGYDEYSLVKNLKIKPRTYLFYDTCNKCLAYNKARKHCEYTNDESCNKSLTQLGRYETANKQRLTRPAECSCGVTVQYRRMSTHCKSIKHSKYLKENEDSIEHTRLHIQAMKVQLNSETSTSIGEVTCSECSVD